MLRRRRGKRAARLRQKISVVVVKGPDAPLVALALQFQTVTRRINVEILRLCRRGGETAHLNARLAVAV
ncbi:MAG: hypothetical protein IKQ12_07660 [Prevotella sp.]|nr:hypothetical protein [Prevotella sp.]